MTDKPSGKAGPVFYDVAASFATAFYLSWAFWKGGPRLKRFSNPYYEFYNTEEGPGCRINRSNEFSAVVDTVKHEINGRLPAVDGLVSYKPLQNAYFARHFDQRLLPNV